VRNSSVISGFHRSVNETFVLLGCYAELTDNQSKKNLGLLDLELGTDRLFRKRQ
jgi:hypothetical protein